MHVDAVSAAAQGAAVVVPFKGKPLLLLPYADVGRSLPSAPKMAQFSLLRDAAQPVAALPATDLTPVTNRAFKCLTADWACNGHSPAAVVPSCSEVATRGTIDHAAPFAYFVDIERYSAVEAGPSLASFTDGPAVALRDEDFAAKRALLGAAARRDGHLDSVTCRWSNCYCAMLRHRITQDAPLFAEVTDAPA